MPEQPNLDSPFTTWMTLPEQMRREVIELAKAGRRHPDARLRRLAWEWARDLAGQATWALALGAALTAVSGGPGDLRGELRRRDEARAIVAVGAPD